ncbi:DUF2492 family protein [Reichenbachiella versicolor]|uniref:DUF2492 family protein n=1 Tax=Reichenbachiella versicolor TaxID=1821036 RepID=UPI000D6DE5AA|nr:DUF2492 family protein [Reichenbachiella versicolor]
MNNIKHIHKLIFLIEGNNAVWTPEQLVDNIGSTLGNDVRFASCSGNSFTKENALEFLLDRQKVTLIENGKISLHPPMQICNGHEEFQS